MIAAAVFIVMVLAIAFVVRAQARADLNRRNREWYAARAEYRQRSAPNVAQFPSRDEIRSSLPKTS